MPAVKKGPQAVDDYASGSENQQIVIDVRANDLVSKKETLWSLNQQDLSQATSAGRHVHLQSGAEVWLQNGVVRYDPGSTWDHLAAGTTATDTFLYAVRLANGVISYASAEVTITGVNDAASISGNATAEVTEDSIATASGTLTVNDADDGQTLLQAVPAGTAGLSGYGTFEVVADGSWTYHLNNDATAVQALNAGTTLTDSIVVSSLDGTATRMIMVTINGADDYNLIMGTPQSDNIDGTAQNDHIIGNGAYDYLNGLEGDDWIELSDRAGGTAGGGADNDRLYGGSADGYGVSVSNLLNGGDGNDTIAGGDGDHSSIVTNEIHGGAGDDTLIGGSALDPDSWITNELWSDGGGNDTLTGGTGPITYNRYYLADGGPGDFAYGANGHDTAFVYREDPPSTYQNNITVHDGFLDYNGALLRGMDYVYAGGGFGNYTATVTGDLSALGDPNFYMQVWANSLNAADTLLLDASGLTSTTIGVELSVHAQPGSISTLMGGAGPDRLFDYSDGNDIIFGNGGNDIISVGRGDDFIDGGTGDDDISLWGINSGLKTIVFGVDSGNDRVDLFRHGILDISAYSQFQTFSDVLAVTTDEWVNGWSITTIQLDENNSIMLTQLAMSELNSSNFIFGH